MNTMKLMMMMVLAILSMSTSCSQTKIDPSSKSIEDAHNAYFQMDHKVAYAIYNNVYTDSSQTGEDRSRAGRELAHMEWLLYTNSDKALRTIDETLLLNKDVAELLMLKSRILTANSDHNESISAAKEAIAKSESETEETKASLRYYSSLFTKSKSQLLETGKISNNAELGEAYVSLQKLATEKTGDVEIAKLDLGYALLLDDGESAFNAWMSFYRLVDISQIHPSLIANSKEFKEAMFDYGNSKESIDQTIMGLAESGFYEYARLVKLKHFGVGFHSNDRINDIMFYNAFLTSLDSITINFYLATVKDEMDRQAYQMSIIKEAQKLWGSIHWEGQKPEFSREGFTHELEVRFKALIKFIHANGYFGLHMGHIVLDDKRVINQYTQSSEFRYLVIDHMVSNGYSSWFWDGLAQVGGWANKDEAFLQVRNAGINTPVHIYQNITDPIKINRTIERMENFKQIDDSLARAKKVVYLTGLTTRIEYNESNKILDSLESLGYQGGELRLKFINEYEQIVKNSTIYAHEGRHAIDKLNGYSEDSEELEYTAKLSEIYFSKKPMIAFNNIMQRNIGDKTSHGQASYRVVKGIVKWMESNSKSIEDFDIIKPALPQLDKLSDRQLKQAVRSLDPMTAK